MAKISCFHFMELCLNLWCVFVQGIPIHETNLYISRALGNDMWPCDKSKPCKTIWRAVSLASCGDRIHLDGHNTDRDPYTCQTGTSKNSVMHITVNLGFFGHGPTPQIQCPEGGFFFDGSGDNCKMNVTLSEILFKETFIVFYDSSANIHRCNFEGIQTTMVFIATKQLSPLWEIQIASSAFFSNAQLISFWTISQGHPLRDVQKRNNLRENVFTFISVLQKQSCLAASHDTLPVLNCNISLTNVTISTKSPNSVSPFCLYFGSGQQNLRLQNVKLVKPSSQPRIGGLMEESRSEVFVYSQQTVNVIINDSKFESHHSRVLYVLAGNISLQLFNSTFIGHAVEGDGGAISLIGKHFCKVKVFKSSFEDTTSTSHGGAISIECGSNHTNTRSGFLSAKAMNFMNGKPSVIHITNTEFRNCSAGRGGAIFLRHSGGSMTILVKESNFTDNHLGGLKGLRGYGGAIGLLLAHDDAQNECANVSTPFEQVNSYLSEHRISDLSVEDTKFERNSGEFGGAIYLINGKATFRDCYFIDNFASADGGHIYADGGSTSIEIQQTLFNQTIKQLKIQKRMNIKLVKTSSQPGIGGLMKESCSEVIVYSQQTVNVIINDSKFESHHSRALYVLAGNISLQLFNSTFIGHAVEGNGGAISLIGKQFCKVKVFKSSFEDTTSTSHGGAINIECGSNHTYLSGHRISDLSVEDTKFERNSGEFGGAIYLINGKATFRNCYFIDNFASADGGHIYADGGSTSIEIQQTLFNQTIKQLKLQKRMNVKLVKPSSQPGIGGLMEERCSEVIVYSQQTVNVIINDSKFESHHSRALYVLAGNISLQLFNSTFIGHAVEGNGGAISLIGKQFCKVKVFKSSFEDTTSTSHGGAINIECGSNHTYLSGHRISDLSVEDTKFERNSGEFGGAIYLINGKATFRNCYFIDNFASADGGHIYADGGSTSIEIQQTLFNQTIKQLKLQKRMNVKLVKPSSQPGIGGLMEESCSEVIVYSQQTVNVIINDSKFESHHSRALYVLAGNISLQLFNSTFTGHAVEGDGGAISLIGKQFCKVKVFRSSFEDTTCTLHGGAISIECGSNHTNTRSGFLSAKAMNFMNGKPSVIHITNTEFRNCSAGRGGAIFLRHSGGSMTILVKESNFTDNHLGGLKGLRGYGGAIGLLLAHDDAQNECANVSTPFEQVNSYLSEHRISNLSVEDTKFERNSGEFGGAIYLINGKATFRDCHFIDNFASTDGGHIYADGGSTSLEIQQTVFNQTIKQLELQKSTKNFTKSSFIHVESGGQLKLYNTTLDSRPYRSRTTLIAVYGARCIEFGKHSSTVFYCPNGSQLEIPFNVTNNHTGVTLRYDCVACSVHMYSLQRGTAFKGILNDDFECLQCPFGADCTRNITAKPNFWGFQMQDNPPALNFTMCPLGYCRPPEKTNSPSEYNGCNGNRSGELCGRCKEAYTEALYSTNCRPSHECNDVWFWFVALAYVFVMALYLTYKPVVLTCIYRQIFWFKEHQTEDKEDNGDSGYLKIVFYFYQAADLLLFPSSSTSVIKTHLFEPVMGIFNFQQKAFYSGSPCPFPGLTVVYKKLFSSIHVFGTLGMICLIYTLHVGAKRIQGKTPPSLDPYLGGILQTMLLGYSRLGSISFDLLRCVPIGSGRRLFYDGNIVCFQWWQYILVAAICTFLVPFVFVLLWGSFKLQSGNISVTHFLLACSLPLPFLLYWVVLSLFCKQRNAASKDFSPSQVSTSSVERVLYDCFKRSEDGKRFSLSWESVMIGRRLILIVLKAFISDPMPRLLIMSFFCVLFLLQHALIQPFRDGTANTVETISLLCVVVLAIENVFFASFLSLAVPITNGHFNFWWKIYQGIEVVLICSFPAVLGLLLAAVILSQMCRLTVLVCRLVYNSCRDLYVHPHQYSRLQDHADRTKPLLAPFT